MTNVERLWEMLNHPDSTVTEDQMLSILGLLAEAAPEQREAVLEQVFLTLIYQDEPWRLN